jgi:hypothetical protein
MRSSFCALVVAAVVVFPIAAKADVVTFDLSGTINYTNTVSGTLLIDTTTGTFVSGDLQYQGMNFDVGGSSTLEDYSLFMPMGSVIGLSTAGSDPFPYFDILLPQNSLVGYTGGSLCYNASPSVDWVVSNCGDELISLYTGLQGGPAEQWTSGLVSPTPEPSTLLLLGTAGLLLLAVGRRKPGNAS